MKKRNNYKHHKAYICALAAWTLGISAFAAGCNNISPVATLALTNAPRIGLETATVTPSPTPSAIPTMKPTPSPTEEPTPMATPIPTSSPEDDLGMYTGNDFVPVTKDDLGYIFVGTFTLDGVEKIMFLETSPDTKGNDCIGDAISGIEIAIEVLKGGDFVWLSTGALKGVIKVKEQATFEYYNHKYGTSIDVSKIKTIKDLRLLYEDPTIIPPEKRCIINWRKYYTSSIPGTLHYAFMSSSFKHPLLPRLRA